MAATDPVTTAPRRISIRLPQPLWIGLAAASSGWGMPDSAFDFRRGSKLHIM